MILALLAVVAPAAGAARSAVVRDGNARFQVLTPTLIRLESAADGRFEGRPTMTAANRRFRHTYRRGEDPAASDKPAGKDQARALMSDV